MKHYAKTFWGYFEKTAVKEQLFQSKAKTKSHTLKLIMPAFAEDIENKFLIESTLVKGLNTPIITGSQVFLYHPTLDGYVVTSIVEYAQMMRWCHTTGKPVEEVEWLLSDNYQGVYARVYHPETMTFLPDISEQQLHNELLISTNGRSYGRYAWKYGDEAEEAASWSKEGVLCQPHISNDISVANYVPLTALDPELKNKLSAAAALAGSLHKVKNPNGISVGGTLRTQIERQLPTLDPRTLVNRPHAGVLNEVYTYARSSYQLSFITAVRGDLSALRLYPLQYFLPFSMWQNVIEDIPNEMHADYAKLWGLPRKLEMNALVSEGTNLAMAHLTITAMPNIQDKQIQSYSLVLLWNKVYPWIKQSKIHNCKVVKNKLIFEVSSFEEIRPLILEYLSQMCTHVKVAVSRMETPTGDTPWLSYAADFTTGFTPISLTTLKGPPSMEYDNDIPF